MPPGKSPLSQHFYAQGEETDLFQGLDLYVLDQEAQLGDWEPLTLSCFCELCRLPGPPTVLVSFALWCFIRQAAL